MTLAVMDISEPAVYTGDEGSVTVLPPVMLNCDPVKDKLGVASIVKFGYAPFTFTFVLGVIATGWSGAVLVMIFPVMEISVPAEYVVPVGSVTVFPSVILSCAPDKTRLGVEAIVKPGPVPLTVTLFPEAVMLVAGAEGMVALEVLVP